MNKIELDDFELLYLRALLGNGHGPDKRVVKIYTLLNKIIKDKGYEYHHANCESYSKEPYIKAAQQSLDSFKTPFEKLLIKNGFKKLFDTLYSITLGYNRITIDSENGTCNFDNSRIRPIKDQADIDKLLYVLGEGV